ncbi:MAG TPA: hydrogenase formation protein HypD [Thermodesulfovibrionales bacterium]|nr:hydrogenase formation protein HypD [Thermodesulfovibrionales bacterium]
MQKVIEAIHNLTKAIGRPIKLMEVCGTHTVAIFRHGIRGVIPKEISLLSGPGCPVCVTPIRDVDMAIAISKTNGFLLTTFGDMMRVPGSKRQSLFHAQAEGANIQIVYSPMDALDLAVKNKDIKVVFFATGFETTSPSIAGTLAQAESLGAKNFYIYSAHKVVPPALRVLLDSPDLKIDGFILPGHVSTIIGTKPYEFMASDYKIPGVVTGFDAEDILTAIMMILAQIAEDRAAIEIQYTRVVRPEGNRKAMQLIDEFFEPADANWRGIGVIPGSGLALRPVKAHLDINRVLSIDVADSEEPTGCQCGQVLRGIKIPTDCKLFGKGCTPEHPVGACMVSTEGSCAAYYKYSGVVKQ